ncbi:MAG: flippase-like domain-containing protein [Cyanobacteria bacterium]|nr:flippase-like domain-containing protein [Cyanobacteriota bacterium]
MKWASIESPLKLALKVIVSVGLLYFFLQHAGVEDTFHKLSTANLWYIPIGVVLYLVSQFISAYRWKILAQALRFSLSLREYFDYYLTCMFFSLFLPGSIGGDVVKMFYLANRTKRSKFDAFLTILAERGFGLLAVLLVTGLACLSPETQLIPAPVRYFVVTLLGGCLLGYLLLRIVPVQKFQGRWKLLDVVLQAEVFWSSPPLLFRALGVSMGVQVLMILVQYLITIALGIEIPLPYLIAVYGIAGLLSVIPIAFNGIGVREGAYVSLFQPLGIPPETGLAFALYSFLISSITSLLGGLVLLKGHYQTPGQLQAQENLPIVPEAEALPVETDHAPSEGSDSFSVNH